MQDNNDDVEAKKLQKQLFLTTGYVVMLVIALYFLYISSYGRFYEEKKFSEVVNQLNQLSADAEKASGS